MRACNVYTNAASKEE